MIPLLYLQYQLGRAFALSLSQAQIFKVFQSLFHKHSQQRLKCFVLVVKENCITLAMEFIVQSHYN